jgi:hypothetical protein
LPCQVTRRVLEQRGKQIELFVEQGFVFGQIETEQRKRLGERAAAKDYFSTPVGDGIERREALKDADRIVRRQHSHRGAETDAFGARGNGGEYDIGGGNREVWAVVLA